MVQSSNFDETIPVMHYRMGPSPNLIWFINQN